MLLESAWHFSSLETEAKNGQMKWWTKLNFSSLKKVDDWLTSFSCDVIFHDVKRFLFLSHGGGGLIFAICTSQWKLHTYTHYIHCLATFTFFHPFCETFFAHFCTADSLSKNMQNFAVAAARWRRRRRSKVCICGQFLQQTCTQTAMPNEIRNERKMFNSLFFFILHKILIHKNTPKAFPVLMTFKSLL